MAVTGAENFCGEVWNALVDFLGLSPQGAAPVLSELLGCLEAETRILDRYCENADSRLYQDALDSLLTVSEKLSSAYRLRSLVGRLAGSQKPEGKDERKAMIQELLNMLQRSRIGVKRF